MTKDEKGALRVEIARIENRRNCLILEAISTVREVIVGVATPGGYGGMADDGPTMTGLACGYLDRLRETIAGLTKN